MARSHIIFGGIWQYSVFDVGNPNNSQIPGYLGCQQQLPVYLYFGGICSNKHNGCSRTNGLWSPSFVAASCPSEKTFKKKIIWVFRVAKGIQRYLMRSHMVANSCRGLLRVFHGIVKRNEFYIRNTQYLTVWGYLMVFKIWSKCFHMVARGYCNTIEYCQILYNMGT